MLLSGKTSGWPRRDSSFLGPRLYLLGQFQNPSDPRSGAGGFKFVSRDVAHRHLSARIFAWPARPVPDGDFMVQDSVHRAGPIPSFFICEIESLARFNPKHVVADPWAGENPARSLEGRELCGFDSTSSRVLAPLMFVPGAIRYEGLDRAPAKTGGREERESTARSKHSPVRECFPAPTGIASGGVNAFRRGNSYRSLWSSPGAGVLDENAHERCGYLPDVRRKTVEMEMGKNVQGR